MEKQDNAKLELWQGRLSRADLAYAPEVAKMDHREALFKGDRTIRPMVEGDKEEKTCHVRNIIFENIESQVSSTFPMPKVTPKRERDEQLAAKIEHFIRNELERMPFDLMNDLAERTVPIQGGVGWLVEWDNSKRTHDTIGEVDVATVHPKQFAPQPGVYTGVRDMDWFIIKEPTTKAEVWRRYGKSVYAENEAEPELRSTGSEDHSDDMVTRYVGYAKNDEGGVDKFVWVNDVVLEDLTDYRARRVPVCQSCGRVRPMRGQVIQHPAPAQMPAQEDPEGLMAAMLMAQGLADGTIAGDIEAGSVMDALTANAGDGPTEVYDGGPCPWCGGKDFADEKREYEQVFLPVETAHGLQIPGVKPGLDDDGKPAMIPTKIPFYKPDIMPVLLQKSVSVFGQLLGNSDVDIIEDQQNTVNRLEQKIIDRLLKAGTRITLPDKPEFKTSPKDGEKWYIGNAADKNLIDVYDFKGDLQYELHYLAQVYEESRQILGITDSFQGRRDPTATSGVAKEYAAQRSAGRMESKRIMKNAAYAELFEMIFKNWLAYADEPRPVSYKNHEGKTQYESISRYDFLEKDADGQYWWNDMFLFSCDSTAPLANDREAMWQETRMNLQTGAFGDPAATETLILFWSKMEMLHYPGAAETKRFLEERLQREQQMQRR